MINSRNFQSSHKNQKRNLLINNKKKVNRNSFCNTFVKYPKKSRRDFGRVMPIKYQISSNEFSNSSKVDTSRGRQLRRGSKMPNRIRMCTMSSSPSVYSLMKFRPLPDCCLADTDCIHQNTGIELGRNRLWNNL